jgi:MFS family permease
MLGPPRRVTTPRGLAALRHRDYQLFFAAFVVAGLGTSIVRTATLFQVYSLTGSSLQLGLLSLATGAPTILLTLMGGVIADRADRRHVLLVGQTLTAILGLAIAALTALDRIEVWHLYALTLCLAVVASLSSPARTAMIPSLVSPSDLVNAVALNSTGLRISALLGPALAGASIAALGLPFTYAAIGVTSLAANVGVALLRLPRGSSASRGNVLHTLREGAAFVRAVPIIPVLLSLDMAAQFFGGYRALLPVIADRLQAGPEGYGLLVSAVALGGLCGAAALLGVQNMRYPGLFVAGAVLAFAVALLVLALSSWYPLTLVAVLALGACDAMNAIPRNAVIQRLTPDYVRGRVAALQSMLVGGVPPLGEAQAGAVASVIGVPLALVVGAVGCASWVVFLVTRRRDLRQPDLVSPNG